MKLFAILVLAASLLLSSLASDIHSPTLAGPEPQHKCPDSSKPSSKQAPGPGRAQAPRVSSVAELKSLLDETGLFERHFDSEKKRDAAFVRVIVSDYDLLVERMVLVARDYREPVWSNLPSWIKLALAEDRLIKLLPKLSSSNPKTRLLNLLRGVGSFSKLHPPIRQAIARMVWGVGVPVDPKIGSLSSFLSLCHDAFDKFKYSLLGVDIGIAEMACLKIVLGIDSKDLPEEDRKKLLLSIKALFFEHRDLGMVCSLHGALSPKSTISEIASAVQSKHPHLNDIAAYLIQSLPDYAFANWCMTVLNRPAFPLRHTNLHYHLLFSDIFREKHGISDSDQNELLKSCKAGDLLRSLPPVLDALDIPALIQWVKGSVCISSLSPSDTVTLYSLDDSTKTLDQYPQLSKYGDSLTFPGIALELDCARYLSLDKKIALLGRLDPECLNYFAADLKGNRKKLVARVVYWYGQHLADDLVDVLSDADFSLLVQTWLDGPATDTTYWLDGRREKLAVQTLIQYIGEDTEKAAKLKKLPERYQIMVFFLTDCEAVAALLSEFLNDRALVSCLSYSWISGLGQEKAAKTAQRAYAHHERWSKQLQQ